MINFTALPTVEIPSPSIATIGVFHGATEFAELLRELEELTAARNGERLMLVLEEGDQMFYTASHAGEEHFDLPANVDELDDLEDDNYERALIQDRYTQLQRTLPWKDMENALPLSAASVEVVRTVNAEPNVLVEPYHCVQKYETPGPLAWLASLPNGYFAGDLTPQQVLALSTQIEATTPYEMLGMGGNFLGFRKRTGDVDKPALMRTLAHVYGAELTLEFGELLFLPYTGTADQYLERTP